jgi:hypothetical protein
MGNTSIVKVIEYMLQMCNIQREAAMLLVYNWKIN